MGPSTTHGESRPGSPNTNGANTRLQSFALTKQTMVTFIAGLLHHSPAAYFGNHPNPHARLYSALIIALALIVVAFGTSNIIAYTSNSSAYGDSKVGLLLLGNLVLWVVAGVAWLSAPSWTGSSISRHLYMLPRPHIVGIDSGESNVVFYNLEVEEMA